MAGADGGMIEGIADAGDWVWACCDPLQLGQQHWKRRPRPNFRPRYVAQINKAIPIKMDDVIPTLNPWSSKMWKPLDLSWMTVLPWISLRYLASLPSKTSQDIAVTTDTTLMIMLVPSMLVATDLNEMNPLCYEYSHYSSQMLFQAKAKNSSIISLLNVFGLISDKQ